jgi:hypothetical protein
MSRVLTTAVAAIAALTLAGPAGAMPIFGVSDDRGKYDEDGGAWFFSELTAAGLTANKMTVSWDPEHPLDITERAFLDRAIPEAEKLGIHLSFGIHIGKARAITGDPEALQKFTDWLRILAATYPQVKEFVVGNEPNLTRFWQPQFNPNGTGASGIAFAKFLAASYDALKEVNEDIVVVGVGLSPRGNDMPNAPSNISTSPVKFIRGLGIGYRRLEREKPIMDVFGFHPYPAKDRDSLTKGYRWPNAGVPNLNRIKQAVWDAFNGTAQPTFEEPGEEQETPLTFKLDEVGWQVAIPAFSRSAYYGRESVKPTDERTQARIYGELVRTISCDPSVRELLFFGLVDEPNLDRWQAGLIRADKSRRPAWATVRNAVAGGRCTSRRVLWQHTEQVIGARVRLRGSFAVLSAEEDAVARVGGVRYQLRAYRPIRVRVRPTTMVEFTAKMNPERFTVLAVD